MQYAFRFVPNKQLKKKKKKDSINKVHQFQQVSIRKRPKACWNQPEVPPQQASDCLQRIFNQKKEERKRKRNEHFKISKEAFQLHFPRAFLRKEISNCPVLTLSKLRMGPSIICFVTSFTPKAYPPPSSTLCPPPFCQARHAVWLTKPCRNPSRLSFHTS